MLRATKRSIVATTFEEADLGQASTQTNPRRAFSRETVDEGRARRGQAIIRCAFYPALRDHPEAREVVLEGYEEHHVADLIVAELHENVILFRVPFSAPVTPSRSRAGPWRSP